ncbi:uncharacterized protein HD556DRAFT_1368664 [Suillus plorans]|uniref:Uncharacterized protein n=1 Tax=Suillus plorans TaxID=116603 RepID=A0A9P7AR09_9AGAM|nr:uncharacterized protein HD556DRAFT_1368664 [Suillus plorans]KAG1794616.1 hypothetical protein HD556DRAFT_1368664 [Suillus plorans]
MKYRCVLYIVLTILGSSMGYDALSWIDKPHKRNAVRKVENSRLDGWEMNTQYLTDKNYSIDDDVVSGSAFFGLADEGYTT